MKTFRIVGYRSHTNNTLGSLAGKWYAYLYCVGCNLEIKAQADEMLITWDTSLPTTIHHILNMVVDTFGDSYDTYEISSSIKSLKDNQMVSFYVGHSRDHEDGKVEIVVL